MFRATTCISYLNWWEFKLKTQAFRAENCIDFHVHPSVAAMQASQMLAKKPTTS